MVSRTDDLELMNALANEALRAFQINTPTIVFGRLRKGFRKIVTSKQVIIWSPYYWLRFANDGRGEVTPRIAKLLAWFRNPKDDPRISEDYYRDPSRIPRLAQLMSPRAMREARRRGDLILAHRARGTAAKKFLEAGLKLARKRVPEEVRTRIRTDIRQNIRRSFNSITVRL